MDWACTSSTSGSGTRVGCSGSSPTAGMRQRALSAAPPGVSRVSPATTIEEVLEQRLSAAAASADPQQSFASAGRGVRPSSAALAAWAAASGASMASSSNCCTAGPPTTSNKQQLRSEAWQEEAWDAYGRPAGPSPASKASGSSFLQRVANFTAGQHSAQAAMQATLAEPSLCCSSSSSSSSSSGGNTSSNINSSSRGSDSTAGLEATHIPPAMLSALHTVRMSPRLLSGLPGKAVGESQHQRQRQRCPAEAAQPSQIGAPVTQACGGDASAQQRALSQAAIQAPCWQSAGCGTLLPRQAVPRQAAARPLRVTGSRGGRSLKAGAAEAAGSAKQLYRQSIEQQAVHCLPDC
jgi:hypothetical protein